MTRNEIDLAKYEYTSGIMDKFRDIQRLSNSLKNPEDRAKNIATFARISDCFTDVQRYYELLEAVLFEEPED